MNLRFVRRMSAELIGCGENRVWLDPDKSGEISAAITRDDVRRLIREGKISAHPEHVVSRGRLRRKRLQISKGRRRGQGSRKGGRRARTPRKEAWVRSVRPIRDRLAQMRDQRKIDRADYRKLYLMAKSGFFRSVSHLETYLSERNLLRD